MIVLQPTPHFVCSYCGKTLYEFPQNFMRDTDEKAIVAKINLYVESLEAVMTDHLLSNPVCSANHRISNLHKS